MRSRRLWIVAVLVWCGCSVPDDPEWSEVHHGIAMPPSTLVNAKRWTANRNAARMFGRAKPTETLFTVQCEAHMFNGPQPPEEESGLMRFVVTASDLMLCLDGAIADETLVTCVERIIKDREDSYRLTTGYEPDCIVKFEPWVSDMIKGFGSGQIETTVDEFDPDKVVIDDVERDLVQSPVLPRWLPFVVIGGVVVVGGLTGGAAWLPALCTLQAGSGPACPGNPAYPPGATPQPGQGSP